VPGGAADVVERDVTPAPPQVVELGGGFVQAPGAEAPAEDGHEGPVGGGVPLDGDDRGPDRVAGDDGAPQRGAGERDGGPGAEADGDPVGQPRGGVLLVDDGGDAPQPGGHQTRQRGVATDADDDLRPGPADDLPRHLEGLGRLQHHGDVLGREPALQAPAGEDLDRESGGRHSGLLELPGAADPVDRLPRVTPGHQRLGQGQAGIDVAAGPAAGDQGVCP
jgi:hypothetical protein